MESGVRVLATFVSFDDWKDELLALLRSLVPVTRSEHGCLQYDLWTSRKDACRFHLVERWADDAVLDRHLNAEHLIAAKSRFPALLAEPLRIERCVGLECAAAAGC